MITIQIIFRYVVVDFGVNNLTYGSINQIASKVGTRYFHPAVSLLVNAIFDTFYYRFVTNFIFFLYASLFPSFFLPSFPFLIPFPIPSPPFYFIFHLLRAYIDLPTVHDLLSIYASICKIKGKGHQTKEQTRDASVVGNGPLPTSPSMSLSLSLPYPSSTLPSPSRPSPSLFPLPLLKSNFFIFRFSSLWPILNKRHAY